MVYGECLVVAQGENVGVGQESGVVDGAAVVLHLEESVVLVCDGGVVDVDEAVGAAGEETLVLSGVELQVCYVVVVAFGVGL